MNRIALLLLVIVLVVALVVTMLWSNEVGPGKPPHLAHALPASLPGWEVRDLPLGETESVRGTVEKTLRFDDVLYREYRSSKAVFSIYVAYWPPGKMPVQLVASHTPDRCWSSAGWVCIGLEHNRSFDAGGVALRAGERRVFEAANGGRLNVHYWHLIGGVTYNYGERFNQIPSVWRWWRDAAMQVFRAPGEQYFVRLASDQPFEALQNDPGWQQLLAALSRLGLGRT